MGVHNWDSELWQEIWPQLIQDTRLIIEAADVLVTGPTAGGDPRIDDPEPPIVNIDDGIDINGVWDDSHEPFVFPGKTHGRDWCKTLRKPYDKVVACVLLRAYMLGPQSIKVSSDGNWTEPEWKRARELYSNLWPEDSLKCPWKEEGDSDNKAIENAACGLEELLPRAAVQDNSAAGASKIQLSHTQVESALTTVSQIDLDRVKTWLAWCDKEQGHCVCRASSFQVKDIPGVRFRLIDVQRGCVVFPPRNVAFIALTYVWGGVEQLRLNRAIESDLMQDGGLGILWSRLSTTVRDAMVVCEKLGERYLWADTLCIMQDSWRDMNVQVMWMRQIYASAKCAIAAISAATADNGLLISPSAKCVTPTSEDALIALIESSPWSRRAWCYQEKVLSHRVILFTHCGIYAQCQVGSYNAEGAQLMRTNFQLLDKYNTFGGMLFVPKGEDHESFFSAVEYYSQRELTRPEDKKHAFEGIFRQYAHGMDGQKSSFLFGLPISAFDQAFCWRASTHDPRHRNPAYPSWSWLGWNTAVSFDRKILKHARTNQLIYRNDEYSQSGHEVDWRAMHELRKPASRAEYWTPQGDSESFGFPATSMGIFAYRSTLHCVQASIAKLLISYAPVESNGLEGRYSVFPIWCSEQPPGPSPNMDTYKEWCDRQTRNRAMMAILSDKSKDECLLSISSKPNITNSEVNVGIRILSAERHDSAVASTDITASPQRAEKTRMNHNIAEHERHRNCEAQTPLGSIWLDRTWREQRSSYCIMDFMALAGERDPIFGNWVITMLMLLREDDSKYLLREYERVQVMGSSIEQQRWLKAGAETAQISIA